jgi:hypothetical protein
VKNKGFVWERPLRPADLRALGDAAPDGPILGVRVEHLGAKEALLADDPAIFFTTPHFDGYPAVLVRLERIGREDLEEVIVEAWLARAPVRLAREYIEASARSGSEAAAPSGSEAAAPSGSEAAAQSGSTGIDRP